MSFQSIPILDLADGDKDDRREQFLADLRYALIDVGFLYIKTASSLRN